MDPLTGCKLQQIQNIRESTISNYLVNSKLLTEKKQKENPFCFEFLKYCFNLVKLNNANVAFIYSLKNRFLNKNCTQIKFENWG